MERAWADPVVKVRRARRVPNVVLRASNKDIRVTDHVAITRAPSGKGFRTTASACRALACRTQNKAHMAGAVPTTRTRPTRDRPSKGWCITPTPAPSTPRSATLTASPTPARWPPSEPSPISRSKLRQRPGRVRDRALQTECVRPEAPWRAVDDLELATLGWVHWFNQARLSHGVSGMSHRSSTRPTTTVGSPPDSNRCRENPASTKPGALQGDAG